MTTEDFIKARADWVWIEIEKDRGLHALGLSKFSPESLRLIDRVFQDPDHKTAGGILSFSNAEPQGTIQREDRCFALGAYIGEVVRQNVNGTEWGDFDDEAGLSFSDDRPPVLPSRFIEEQLKTYKPGSVVDWGRNAGLKI